MSTSTTWPDAAASADLAALRSAGPLTHCLTNVVAAPLSANVLLALGAAPVMVENAEESADFAGLASGMLANLGTLSSERDRALRLAASGAKGAGTPWVLDPVAAGALPYRTNLAADLVEQRPWILRGNASEVLSLTGATGAAGKGVESTAGSHEAVEAARAFADQRGCVVAVSGEVDYVTDGAEVVEIPGGHRLMTKVTGVGCALGATMAAFLAVAPTPLRAATTASVIFAAAGERAARTSSGPGSFEPAFLDALHALGSEDRR